MGKSAECAKRLREISVKNFHDHIRITRDEIIEALNNEGSIEGYSNVEIADTLVSFYKSKA
jgi:hypothetical protein